MVARLEQDRAPRSLDEGRCTARNNSRKNIEKEPNDFLGITFFYHVRIKWGV